METEIQDIINSKIIAMKAGVNRDQIPVILFMVPPAKEWTESGHIYPTERERNEALQLLGSLDGCVNITDFDTILKEVQEAYFASREAQADKKKLERILNSKP